jgi:hypothetical protein
MSPKDIPADDPEFVEIMRTLHKPVYPIGEIIKDRRGGLGPLGRTETYSHVGSGALVTFTVGSGRFATAADFGKWLLWLKREGQQTAPRAVGRRKAA